MAASDPAHLAERLRLSTASVHRDAERSPLMRRLLAGRAERTTHLALLQQLLPVYATLESLVDAHAAHPWLAAVWHPELARTDALRADLGAHTNAPLLPATAHYVQRLLGLDDGAPVSVARLLAHVYVRHLGDLSGGQILQRVLGAAPGLRDETGQPPGLTFHQFGSPSDVARLKARMRGGLAALPAQGEAADAAVDEALWAFAQHLRLFDELAAAPAGM